jgi:ribosomal protein S18 acetylase RimI-like enzyme
MVDVPQAAHVPPGMSMIAVRNPVLDQKVKTGGMQAKLPSERVNIRAAGQRDLPAITEQLRESTSGVVHAVLGEAGVRAWLETRLDPTGPGCCTAAEILGVIAGHEISYGECAVEQDDVPGVSDASGELLRRIRTLRVPGSWYVSSLAVLPEFRCRGLGARLLGIAAAKAQLAGVPVLSLHVFAEKAIARRLYLSAGLAELGRTTLPSHPALTADSPLLLMAGPVARILRSLGRIETSP